MKTEPFMLASEKQFVEVFEGETLHRSRWPSNELIDECYKQQANDGCAIEAIAVSPKGHWLVTQRYSGQGEWGYDVFQTAPLKWVAGIGSEPGYILETPVFSLDESFIAGLAGEGFLGQWWMHPDDEPEDPVRGGPLTMGFLFIHQLPNHAVTRHELQVNLPKGWLPDDPWADWYGPQSLSIIRNGVRFLPSWSVPVEVTMPLPSIITLPVPDPSGQGVLE